jgi:myo-inositol-1(or 4)-monophosphatase
LSDRQSNRSNCVYFACRAPPLPRLAPAFRKAVALSRAALPGYGAGDGRFHPHERRLARARRSHAGRPRGRRQRAWPFPAWGDDLGAGVLEGRRLGRAFPEAGWLSEETADDARRLDRRHVLVVDPIDGTRAFIRGDARWAVCAALVEDGRPIAGVVHLPARGETFAAARGAGATLDGAPIRVSRHATLTGARASGPKPLIEGFNAAGAGLVTMEREPSLAYRIVSVAVGRLDIAFASARSHDWDLAAADLILQEAGGALTDLEGIRPLYNRPETRHPELAAAPIALSETLLSAARRARR